MRYVACNGLDKQWSVITMGCWQIAPSEGWGDICSAKDADAAIKAALAGGITAFDTAEGYGDGESERRLGNALGHKKYDVIVISKIWPDAELTLKSYQDKLDASLKALNRDYIDVYLVHWPGSFFNTREKSAKLCEIMSALKQSGKTKLIGLSNFHINDLSLLEKRISSFAINQVPYSLLDRHYEGKTRALCQQAETKYMAYSPTAMGLLARDLSKAELKHPARRNHPLYQEPVFSRALKVFNEVKKIALEINANPIHVTLAWTLTQKNILTAIVGSRNSAQVHEFVKSGDLLLGKQHLDRLTTASDFFKEGR